MHPLLLLAPLLVPITLTAPSPAKNNGQKVDLHLNVFTQPGCNGDEVLGSGSMYGDQVSDTTFTSYILSRDLLPEEQLDFSIGGDGTIPHKRDDDDTDYVNNNNNTSSDPDTSPQEQQQQQRRGLGLSPAALAAAQARYTSVGSELAIDATQTAVSRSVSAAAAVSETAIPKPPQACATWYRSVHSPSPKGCVDLGQSVSCWRIWHL